MPRQGHDGGQPQRKRGAEPRGTDAAPSSRRHPARSDGDDGDGYLRRSHRALRLAFRDDGNDGDGEDGSPLRNLSSTSDVVDLRSPAKRPRPADGPFCPPATTAFPHATPAKTPRAAEGRAAWPGADVTAETAELSYEDDGDDGGSGRRCLPAFPISSVKRHPAETSGEAWGSPPRSKVRMTKRKNAARSSVPRLFLNPAPPFFSLPPAEGWKG